MPEAGRIILASGSATRRTMLEAAGVLFSVEPAIIDEVAIREMLLADDADADPADIADVLARTKAETVSAANPDAIVVGADLAFLSDYMVRSGPALLESVGAYRLEGRGIQLFERIDGDYFTILGMPLLPLLTELRERGALAQ